MFVKSTVYVLVMEDNIVWYAPSQPRISTYICAESLTFWTLYSGLNVLDTEKSWGLYGLPIFTGTVANLYHPWPPSPIPKPPSHSSGSGPGSGGDQPPGVFPSITFPSSSLTGDGSSPPCNSIPLLLSLFPEGWSTKFFSYTEALGGKVRRPASVMSPTTNWLTSTCAFCLAIRFLLRA